MLAVELLQGSIDIGFHLLQPIGCRVIDGNGLILRLNAVDVGNRQRLLGTLHHRLVVFRLLLVATPTAFEKLQFDVLVQAFAESVVAVLEEDAVAPPLVRHLVRNPRKVGNHRVDIIEIMSEDYHIAQRLTHHKLRVADLHNVHRLVGERVAEEGAIEVVGIDELAVICIWILRSVACKAVEMEGARRRVNHLASIFVLRQQNKMDVERRLPFRAANDVIVVRRDVDLRRQQLAIAVWVPVALASQNNGTIGCAVIGKRQGIGGIDLDGLSRIGFVGDEIKT